MEGVSAEAASLAGRLKLGRLVVLYDLNKISLDGKLDMSFTENVRQRSGAYGWQEFVGSEGVALSRLIASASGERVLKEYDFTAEQVAEALKCILKKNLTV